jgi:hypothetical protein
MLNTNITFNSLFQNREQKGKGREQDIEGSRHRENRKRGTDKRGEREEAVDAGRGEEEGRQMGRQRGVEGEEKEGEGR